MKAGKILLIGSAFAWFVLLSAAILLLFFPYQRVFQFVFQNMVSGGQTSVSLLDVRTSPTRIEASKLLFGHEALAGQPIFELERARLKCAIAPMLRGVVNVSADALAYGGEVDLDVKGVPILSGGSPKMVFNFHGIDLSKYPAGRLPWLRSMSGILNGRIVKEFSPLARERQKGTFTVSVSNGEIGQISARNLPRFTLPFRTIAAEGMMDGSRIQLNRVLMADDSMVVSGSGTIEDDEWGRTIDLRLRYEEKSKASPLKGKGTIRVSGRLWSPQITIASGK